MLQIFILEKEIFGGVVSGKISKANLMENEPNLEDQF